MSNHELVDKSDLNLPLNISVDGPIDISISSDFELNVPGISLNSDTSK